MSRFKFDHIVAALQMEHAGAYTVGVQLGERTYTFKSNIGDLKVNDTVVVWARGALTIGRVTRLDSIPRLDPDADYRLSWVVQRVDTDWLESTLEAEERLKERLHQSEINDRLKKLTEGYNIDPAKILLAKPAGPVRQPVASDLVEDDTPRGAVYVHDGEATEDKTSS